MKSVQPLSAADAAYLAGLIDGEGTIAMSRRHADERRHLVLSISSTERELVEWARHATGVGKITRKRTVSPVHATGLTYSVSNRQALAVLQQVSPFLRSYKRERARLVLERYLQVTPRNGRYSNDLATRRCEFEDVFAADPTPLTETAAACRFALSPPQSPVIHAASRCIGSRPHANSSS